MESYEVVDAHAGFRFDTVPSFLLGMVAAYLLASGELTSGFFFLVTAIVLYNALSPDKTVDVT